MASSIEVYCSCSKGTPSERAAAASKKKFYFGTTEICFVHDVTWFRKNPGDIPEADLPGLDKVGLTMKLTQEKYDQGIAGGAYVFKVPESKLGDLGL